MPRAKPSKVTADSFAAVIRAFLASPKFGNLAGSTRDHYARALQIAARPDTLGSLSVEEVRPSLVQAHLDGYSDRAGAQSVALTALVDRAH
jgi:hypothetical protein